jgi:hypothetical protein
MADNHGVEGAATSPNWPRVTACLGLIAVFVFGLWMTMVGLLTSSGVYENLEAVERTAGGRIAVVSLLGAVAAIVALGGLVLRSRYWATLGGCGVVATGAAALVVGELWVADDDQQVIASMTVILVGVATIIAGRLMRESAS